MKPLRAGDQAPDFELSDQTGESRRLTELLSAGPVVLFFYPAAMTAGCTKEACHFRDLAAEFAEAGGQRVGISADTVAKQAQFAGAHGFDYPLLSDTTGDVADSYGVRRRLIVPVRRATFVINTDQTIAEVITSEVSMDVHADRALDRIKELASQR